MKVWIKFLTSLSACYLLGYLLGAFVAASFNISDWGEGWRFLWAGLSTLVGITFMVGMGIAHSGQEETRNVRRN